MKKLLSFLLVAIMVLSVVACSESKSTDEKEEDSAVAEDSQELDDESGDTKVEVKKVGVAMPTKDLQRWNQDGENLKKELEAKGFEVDLQFANNDIGTQVSQIENMIANNCNVLVIAAIDGSALTTALEQAKTNNIPIISYDRLIMNSDAISYYATFDNTRVGEIQGQYIVDALDLENTDETFNIEVFTGPTDDNNVNFFYGGAMKVLEPYIDKGTLNVVSGKYSLAEAATKEWSTEESQKRMENLISAYYSDGTQLDAVLSSNDSVANGVTNALVNSYSGDYPVLTGQDCEITSMKNLVKDLQTMSVFKDTRQLAAKVVEMVVAISEGAEVPINDTETYDNGTGIVPSFLLDPIAVDKDNYKEVLIDSGYYSEDDLK